MNKKIAVVLSGCGNQDGAEIHESVLTILSIVKAGAEPIMFAPNILQAKVVNHSTGDTAAEKRNVFSEAARIARGDIKDIKELRESDADALVFPGGLGASLNLCSFAQQGAECEVHEEVTRVVNEFREANKPMGFICIAPVIAARVLGSLGVSLTIGTNQGVAAAIEQMGATHVLKTAIETHIDENLKVVSTPAYMLAENIIEVEKGIKQLIDQVLGMC